MYGNDLVERSVGAIDSAPPTVSERLQREKKNLEERLANVNKAIDALDSSPEIAEAVDALSKLGHF